MTKSPTDFNQSSFFYAQSIWCHKYKFQLYIFCCLLTFTLFGCQNKGASQPVDDWWQIRQLFHYHPSSIIFMNLPFVRTGGEHGHEPTTRICSWQRIMLNVTFWFSLLYIKEGSNTRTDLRVVQLEVFSFRLSILPSVCIISAGCRYAIIFWFQNINHLISRRYALIQNALKNITDVNAWCFTICGVFHVHTHSATSAKLAAKSTPVFKCKFKPLFVVCGPVRAKGEGWTRARGTVTSCVVNTIFSV